MVCFVTLGILLFGGFVGVKNCLASHYPDSEIDLDSLPQDKFIDYLTDPSRYDKSMSSNGTNPFDVNVKMTVMHMEAKKSIYTIHIAVQFDYLDKDLEFGKISPLRSVILGADYLKKRIWTPNLTVKDSKGTSMLGSQQKHTFISIEPTGQVSYSYKIIVTFDCLMQLGKYPFDYQQCTIAFSEWSYDNTHLQLHWDKESPLNVLKLRFNEYVLDEVVYSTEDSFNSTKTGSLSVGNFGETTLTFKFHRDIGSYLLLFFLPSYLLVFTAWVTFWLRADDVSPRGTLGTAPTVAFFILKLGVPTDIPSVSYFKASDFWFLGTFTFTFLSLAEFAFSNVIWRRRKQIQLRKNNHIYMAKSAFMPRKAREDLRKYESSMSENCYSNDSLSLADENHKTLDSSQESLGNTESPLDEAPAFTWTNMTPQELSIYVDRQARIVFPIAFLIFNVVYWLFVYTL